MVKSFFVSAGVLLLGIAAAGQKAELIDQFEQINCEDSLAHTDALADLAKRNPDAKVYVFLYEGREASYSDKTKTTKWVLPPVGQTRARIRSMKKRFRMFKEDFSRIMFISGGIREHATVDIWLVPLDVPPPTPTPTLNFIRHRRGKAYGFCTSCMC